MAKDKIMQEDPAGNDSIKTEQLMYVGPTLLEPVLLQHRSTYKNLPIFKVLTKQQQAALNDCFFPLGEAAVALRELEGTAPSGKFTEKYKTAQRLMRSK